MTQHAMRQETMSTTLPVVVPCVVGPVMQGAKELKQTMNQAKDGQDTLAPELLAAMERQERADRYPDVRCMQALSKAAGTFLALLLQLPAVSSQSLEAGRVLLPCS